MRAKAKAACGSAPGSGFPTAPRGSPTSSPGHSMTRRRSASSWPRACARSAPRSSWTAHARWPPMPAEGGGRVYLVGAGPGDPGLLSARALEVIAGADVILYDRLVGEGVLDGAR